MTEPEPERRAARQEQEPELLGGEPACDLHRVCPVCGALEDGPRPPVCGRCGAARDR